MKDRGVRWQPPAGGAFDPAASVGVFAGVSSFEDAKICAVPYAVDDAVDLAHLFAVELGLVAPERVWLLLSGEPRKAESRERLALLLERGAVRKGARQVDVYDGVEEIERQLSGRGLAVLAAATHGVSDQGGDFLVAADSRNRRLLQTGVSIAHLIDDLSRAVGPAELDRSGRAGRGLLLLDACRGRLIEGTRGSEPPGPAKEFAEALARAQGLAVLAGATLGGLAYDDPSRQNGVFTGAVLDGLRGSAPPGPEGWITVGTLADFVQGRVAAWIAREHPVYADRSLGIERKIEGTAETLPLAPHPKALGERERYGMRRAAALARFRENLGTVLTGAHWDQVLALLPEGAPAASAAALLEEIEALDGTARLQRGFRAYLSELAAAEGPAPVAAPAAPEAPSTAKLRGGKPGAAASRPAPPGPGQAPSWASASGRDQFGLYATVVVAGVKQCFRWIEPGTFLMGSPEGEPGRYSQEGPQHREAISEGFWLADTPCTQAFWKAVMGKNPSRFQAPDRPVEQVSWEDCQAFCRKLGERLGGPGWRLPAEAEWEYACRAGTEAATYAGPVGVTKDGRTPVLNRIAWYRQNSEGGTHPVARKEPNPLGLYDMLGNVFEWCDDLWCADYRSQRGGTNRVNRGGSWGSSARDLRAAYRGYDAPALRWGSLGFRLARGQGLRSSG